MSFVAEDELIALYDYRSESDLVGAALKQACADPLALVRFLGRYTAWNALFGAGVAALAGNIARSPALFLDPAAPFKAVADRSVYVASFFFDAARDEFDDRDTRHRDTHRCLAQATVSGTVEFFLRRGVLKDVGLVEVLLAEPLWLAALRERVGIGYGIFPDGRPFALFRAMGYHLGSELLADREFSLLDQTLRATQPALVGFLNDHEVDIAGQVHNAYRWIRVHSGHGGRAEADHFRWAVHGVEEAFRFIDPGRHADLRHQLHLGFLDFVADHREFFHQVNSG